MTSNEKDGGGLKLLDNFPLKEIKDNQEIAKPTEAK